MAAGRPWSEDDETLRTAVAEGGVRLAIERLPHRTPAAVAVKASTLGLTNNGLRGLPHKTRIASSTRQRASVAPKIVWLDRPLDRGEKELMRRQILHVAAAMAGATRVRLPAVMDALNDLATAKFEPPSQAADLDAEEIIAATLSPQSGSPIGALF